MHLSSFQVEDCWWQRAICTTLPLAHLVGMFCTDATRWHPSVIHFHHVRNLGDGNCLDWVCLRTAFWYRVLPAAVLTTLTNRGGFACFSSSLHSLSRRKESRLPAYLRRTTPASVYAASTETRTDLSTTSSKTRELERVSFTHLSSTILTGIPS